MRTFLKKFTTKISTRTISVCILSLAVVGLIPAAVMAWGPARPTFTWDHPATYVTFNSITNNPVHGDERNFMRAKESTANDGSYNDDVALTAGKKYMVMMYYHNNADTSLNAGGTGIAHGAYARAEVPAIVPNGTPTVMEGIIGATNANPTSVFDEVKFSNTTGKDIALHYVPGSTIVHNFGTTNNSVIPDTILSASGVKLGFNTLDGNLPGCNGFSGYITFLVQADQPSFTFTKQVKVNGTTGWKESVSVAPGTKVDYLLSYKNTSSTVEQKNVTFKDQLPAGLTYVAGSSRLTAGSTTTNKVVGDGISTTGLNVGDYSPGSAAYLVFSATANGAPCTTMTNTAAVETLSGNLKDTASVTQTGQCTLPTTGPVEVIAGLVGVAAITLGIVYFFRSRRDLESAIHDAQTHTHHSNSDNLMLTSAPDTKVEAEEPHAHKSEHPHNK
jgi:uncharacterized repeat protein (TIGR01451 family)